MDIQSTLDNAASFHAQIERMIARAYRDAAEVLSVEEIAECREEAATMTAGELDALLLELRA